jgi:catechol 2,3-dioxygenase-like lactoylglutathione lyase family enzyme
MAISAVNHVAIAVKDMEAALRFYRDLLGMKLKSDQISSIEAHANIFRDPSKGTRRHVQLTYGEGAGQGNLVVTEMPGGSKGQAIMLDEIGISHVSFDTDDVAGLAEKARAAGYKVAEGPFKTPNGGASCYLVDPDGMLVQFQQAGR